MGAELNCCGATNKHEEFQKHLAKQMQIKKMKEKKYAILPTKNVDSDSDSTESFNIITEFY